MPKQKLVDEFYKLICASFPAIYIRSHEHEDAIETIRRICIHPSNKWRLATYDCDEGSMVLQEFGTGWQFVPGVYVPEVIKDERSGEVRLEYHFEQGTSRKIEAAIKGLPGLNFGLEETVEGSKEPEQPTAILVIKNSHMLLNTASLKQMVINQIMQGEKHRQTVVLLSPKIDIPVELEKFFETAIVEHELPDKEGLKELLEGVASTDEIPQDEEEMEAVLKAASGLTYMEAKNAFGLAIVENGRVDAKSVFTRKALALKTTGGLSVYEGDYTFDDIGGLDWLKQYCREMIMCEELDPEYRPRGVLVMGVSGGGKSLLAKALGNETSRVSLHSRPSRALGSLMGQSQHQWAGMLQKILAMAPNIVLFDEVEKAFAGAGEDSKTSGGVKTDMMGEFLQWAEDYEEEVFIIATANDIRPISDKFPEFLGRFDDMFFVDYPDRRAKDMIWEIHMRRAKLISKDDSFKNFVEKIGGLPRDKSWTGREIKKCVAKFRVRRKSGKTLIDIGSNMPILAEQSSETINELRRWASGRCYAAEYEGLYEAESHADQLRRLVEGDGGIKRRVKRRRRPRSADPRGD